MRPVVLITGASRGIGAATARLFAQQGYPVALHYHQNQASALELTSQLRQINPMVFPIQADIRSSKDVTAMLTEIKTQLGPIGILINNAGTGCIGLFTNQTPEQWEDVFAVHCKGAFLCTQGVIPDMIRRQSGVIVNVSSMWGQVGASCEVAYSAAKGALIAFTKALAKELGPSGIRVNCVAPGVIDTDMNAHLSLQDKADLCEETPLGRMGSPDEVAQSIYFLCSEHATFITGQTLSPNGGLVME